MALGNQRLGPRWKGLFYDLGHDLPLWTELSDLNPTSGEKQRALTVSYALRCPHHSRAVEHQPTGSLINQEHWDKFFLPLCEFKPILVDLLGSNAPAARNEDHSEHH
jgi:hypothetical protein